MCGWIDGGTIASLPAHLQFYQKFVVASSLPIFLCLTIFRQCNLMNCSARFWKKRNPRKSPPTSMRATSRRKMGVPSRSQDDVFEVRGILHKAEAANDEFHAVFLDDFAADVEIALFHRVHHVHQQHGVVTHL